MRSSFRLRLTRSLSMSEPLRAAPWKRSWCEPSPSHRHALLGLAATMLTKLLFPNAHQDMHYCSDQSFCGQNLSRCDDTVSLGVVERGKSLCLLPR